MIPSLIYMLRFTIIRLRIPPRRSTRLTLPTPIPTTDEADDLILQDTLQLVEGSENVEENVEVASSSLRNDDNQTNPITSPSVVRPRDQDDPHNDAHPKGENSAKRQKITEHGTLELGGSSFGQD
ncbi:hypothetical protein Tco_1278295 [Tanacetum coccineum]